MAGIGAGHANFLERLIPLAARALADDAQALRDHGKEPAPVVARLEDLRIRHPAVVADTGPGTMYKIQVRAMQALYEAEIQRGQADLAVAATWPRAARASSDGQLAWDEAYCWWRAAEALTKDRAARDAAAEALRRAHELAVDLQATPLLAEIAAMAQSTRISLATIDESPATRNPSPARSHPPRA